MEEEKLDLISRLEGIIEPVLQHIGYGLVRLLFSGKKRPTLQVMIERLDEKPVSIDDCVRVSHEVSALLDIEDPIEGSYRLEVTSPGLDRPLLKKADFIRFQGHAVKVLTHDLIEGRKTFVGTMANANETEIIIAVDDLKGMKVGITYPQIRQAKLVPQF